MKPSRSTLSPKELASLDLMITAAQQRGVGFHEVADDDEDMAEAHAAMVEARWEARHGTVEFPERDREILRQIQQLASSLESRSTLEELLEMRADAIKGATQ